MGMGLGKVVGKRGCIIKIYFMCVWKSQRIKINSLDARVEPGAVILCLGYYSQAPSGSWQSQDTKVFCEHFACLPTFPPLQCDA